MNGIGRLLPLFSLGLLLPLSACSGGGSSGGGAMFIETCSLGCASGAGGVQVACQFNQTPLNQEIFVYFSSPVDAASVNSATLQLVDLSSGASPSGIRFVDPNNPRKVIFRPSVTFGTDGSISFGFRPDATYRIIIPGTAQGDGGPFIRSTGGSSNESRLRCDIHTSTTAIDLVPGAPLVTTFIKQAIPGTSDENDFVPDVPAPGADDVWLGSDIRFEFNDLMNPATLANPATGQAAFVTIAVDLDGLLSTSNDRVPLTGTYAVQLDQVLLRTTMTFTRPGGLPSAGDPDLTPSGEQRKIVVTIPNNLQDVAGNALDNPQIVTFTTEFKPIEAVVLPDADGENFTDTNNQDTSRSSAAWGGGKLTRGWSGGRGRLGDLRVTSGQTVTLSTDSQAFPLPGLPNDLLTNADPGADYTATDPLTWPTITVTDGVFEFTNLTIDPGGTLSFAGANAARVMVRGNANIQGTIDVGGANAAAHTSSDTLGGTGGAGGPKAGAGGDGATRFDSGGTNLLAQGGVDVPDAQLFPEGHRGVGLGGVMFIAAGFGGNHYPVVTPTSTSLTPPSNGTMFYTNDNDVCVVAQVGMPGGGGGFATDGRAAQPASTFALAINGTPNVPPSTEGGGGGPSSEAGLEPPDSPVLTKRKLEGANLRGGSGGGGGGANLYSTGSSGAFGSCEGPGQVIQDYRDHSGAAGGGGGGALQLLVGGAVFSLSGLIDASGGDGGSGLTVNATDTLPAARTKRASPGGGGSGGAVRVQAINMPNTIFSTASLPRISVAGGAGGSTNLRTPTSAAVFTRGGAGGAGLLRLEGLQSTPTAEFMAGLISPTDASVGTNAINVMSIGTWAPPRFRPETYSGSVSCWMKPEGNFFQIVFADDDPGATTPEARFGWDMDVLYSGQSYSYRDPDDSPFTPMSIEERFPNDFEEPPFVGSYLVVRFQGARIAGALLDPCNVNVATGIVAGSLTPWVRHPAELNEFSPRPNMVRFCVVFDASRAVSGPESLIEGVTNLKIRTQPD